MASGSLQLARDTGDEAAFRKAEDALERMEETIDDLSELARRKAAAGTTDGDEESLSDLEADESISAPQLRGLVEDVWEVVGTDAATLEVDAPAGATITTDPETIRPLIENLLKNAVVHAGPGVTVRVGLTDRNGFYVADDGPGIPPGERDRVVEEGYTTAEDGTGMGLNIVDEVATENDWTLTVADSWAGGARIEIDDCALVADPPRDVAPGRSVRLTEDADVGDVEWRGRPNTSRPSTAGSSPVPERTSGARPTSSASATARRRRRSGSRRGSATWTTSTSTARPA